MYDPQDIEQPLSAPDDGYSANLQAYLAAQNALPRAARTVDFETPNADYAAYQAMVQGLNTPKDPVAEAVTEAVAAPAVKKAIRKAKKAVVPAEGFRENALVRGDIVPAGVPVNAQGVVIPAAIAGGVAGKAITGNTGMKYPDWSTMIPEGIRNLFRRNVDTNTARSNPFFNMTEYNPKSGNSPISR